jgi:hypothetical protein
VRPGELHGGGLEPRQEHRQLGDREGLRQSREAAKVDERDGDPELLRGRWLELCTRVLEVPTRRVDVMPVCNV